MRSYCNSHYGLNALEGIYSAPPADLNYGPRFRNECARSLPTGEWEYYHARGGARSRMHYEGATIGRRVRAPTRDELHAKIAVTTARQGEGRGERRVGSAKSRRRNLPRLSSRKGIFGVIGAFHERGSRIETERGFRLLVPFLGPARAGNRNRAADLRRSSFTPFPSERKKSVCERDNAFPRGGPPVSLRRKAKTSQKLFLFIFNLTRISRPGRVPFVACANFIIIRNPA